jgi:NADH:ubiquinone oxidoreductase subunit D
MVLQDLTCAAGVDYDVRIAQPYSSYDDFDFIIPVGTSEIPMIVLCTKR